MARESSDRTGRTRRVRPRGTGGPHGAGRELSADPAGHETPHFEIAEALRDLVLEKLTEKAARYDRTSAKSRLKAEAYDTLAARIQGAGLWSRVPPPGRKPRLTRDELAVAAVRLADQEGLAAVSMRRLAADLGVGTMTLYHYVETKDELLALAQDSVMGEVVLPPEVSLPDDWKAAISVIARRSRDALRRHPWMLELALVDTYGPSSVRHFDQSLRAVRTLEAPLEAKLDVISAVDEYTFGFCVAERDGLHDLQLDDPDSLAYVEALLDTGAFPELSALADVHGTREAWARLIAHRADEARFERNLARLLDGLERGLLG